VPHPIQAPLTCRVGPIHFLAGWHKRHGGWPQPCYVPYRPLWPVESAQSISWPDGMKDTEVDLQREPWFSYVGFGFTCVSSLCSLGFCCFVTWQYRVSTNPTKLISNRFPGHILRKFQLFLHGDRPMLQCTCYCVYPIYTVSQKSSTPNSWW